MLPAIAKVCKPLYAGVLRQVQKHIGDELAPGQLLKTSPNTPRPSVTIRRALESRENFRLCLRRARGLIPRQAIVGNEEVANDGQNEGVLIAKPDGQVAEERRNHSSTHVADGDHARS